MSSAHGPQPQPTSTNHQSPQEQASTTKTDEHKLQKENDGSYIHFPPCHLGSYTSSCMLRTCAEPSPHNVPLWSMKNPSVPGPGRPCVGRPRPRTPCLPCALQLNKTANKPVHTTITNTHIRTQLAKHIVAPGKQVPHAT